jgi:hypothetical protein
VTAGSSSLTVVAVVESLVAAWGAFEMTAIGGAIASRNGLWLPPAGRPCRRASGERPADGGRAPTPVAAMQTAQLPFVTQPTWSAVLPKKPCYARVTTALVGVGSRRFSVRLVATAATAALRAASLGTRAGR